MNIDEFAEYKGTLLDHRTAAPAQSTTGCERGGTDLAVLTSAYQLGTMKLSITLQTQTHNTTFSPYAGTLYVCKYVRST